MKALFYCLLLLFQGAVAQELTTIHGTLLGYDKRPMKKALVRLGAFTDGALIQTAEPRSDGVYALGTDRKGLMEIQFSGVDHALRSVWILVEGPDTIHLDIQLMTHTYVTDFTNVSVIGDFNNFNTSGGKKLEKQPDGTYAAQIETTEKKFAYQIAGLERSGRTVNGQQAEEYVYDGDGDYKSIVSAKKGKVRIVLNPKTLTRGNSKVVVRFDDANRGRGQLSEILQDLRSESDAFIGLVQQAQASGKDPREVAKSYDWTKAIGRFEQELKSEKHPLLRQALFVGYFALGGEKKDSSLAASAIEEVPPISPLWVLSPPSMKAPFYFARRDSEASAYVEQAIDKNPEASVRAYLLFDGLMMATYASQTEKARKYYDRLTTDHADTRYAKMARDRLSPDRAVTVGKPLPSFSIAALDAPSTIYSNESLKGKIVMIDFWAVWCGPCVKEMDVLHKAYERFKGKGLEILSLSFDRNAEDIREFRRGKWTMPWLHAFVEGGFNSKLAEQFEVVAIPKPILVDDTGAVLAIGRDLRGENLEKTLAKYLKD